MKNSKLQGLSYYFIDKKTLTNQLKNTLLVILNF